MFEHSGRCRAPHWTAGPKLSETLKTQYPMEERAESMVTSALFAKSLHALMHSAACVGHNVQAR